MVGRKVIINYIKGNHGGWCFVDGCNIGAWRRERPGVGIFHCLPGGNMLTKIYVKMMTLMI